MLSRLCAALRGAPGWMSEQIDRVFVWCWVPAIGLTLASPTLPWIAAHWKLIVYTLAAGPVAWVVLQFLVSVVGVALDWFSRRKP